MTVTAELLRLRDAITTADECEPLLVVTLPLATVSEANRRDKWAGVKRAKAQRGAVQMAVHLKQNALVLWNYSGAGLVVRLVRVAPRALDSDNLARALKAVRDGIAAALGIDDRDPRVEWLPDQTSGKAAVVIEFYKGAVRTEAK